MTNPMLFKKKPLPVLAYLWDGTYAQPSHVPPGKIHDVYVQIDGRLAGLIDTREGPLHIYANEHYIVGPGAEGEFWPVKKSIFEATYEPA